MTLTVQENAEANRYEAVDESGVVAGFVEYVDHRGTRLLFHTEVDDAYEGQGIGSTLAREAIEQALADDRPVDISCPFLKAWVEKNPEYADRVRLRS
jgi:predicted GNAT family acetyltransferase